MSAVAAVVTSTADSQRSRFGDVLHSEFCKLRSVRSTFWTLVAAVVFNVVFAALVAIFIPPHLSTQDLTTTDPIRLSLAGCTFPTSRSACSAPW